MLGDDLLGVYAGGSLALGAYEPGRSDLDVSAVVAAPLAPETKRALVAALRHEALPCPARGLELVVYPLATVQAATSEPGFDLNLNTGERMDFRADEAPGDIEGFWFAIDRAILRDHGIAVHGPPVAELFAPIPREAVLPLLAESRALAPRLRRARWAATSCSTPPARCTSPTPASGSRSARPVPRYLEAALSRLDRGVSVR